MRASAAPSGPSRDDPEIRARLGKALRESYFARCDPGYLDSQVGRDDLADHLHRRYEACVAHVVPWLARHVSLETAEIVEIGCGTGSSTAGFAARPSRARLRHRRAERLESIRVARDLPREGGLLVVVETPNRLAFTDSHTSLLPFSHMLPDELALRYAHRSPRALFRDAIANALEHSTQQALDTLARWGRGVGYHEFELVLGPLGDLVVASGYEPEMLAMFPLQPEESLLQTWFLESGLDVPLAFTRRDLNFILRKGGRRAGEASGHSPPAGKQSAGAELAGMYADLLERHGALEASGAGRIARVLERHPMVARVVRGAVRLTRRSK